MTDVDAPLFGKAPSEHWPKLAKAAHLLIDRALPNDHPWQDHARADLEALLPGLTPAESVTPEELDAVMDAFGKKHPIGEAAFAAFLAARVQPANHRAAGNKLSAWVLAAALQRRRATPGQNALRQGLAAARGLKLNAPEALGRTERRD